MPDIFSKFSNKKGQKKESPDTESHNASPRDCGIMTSEGHFSGDFLFRISRFKLATSVPGMLKECRNRHFFRAMTDHAESNSDPSLIPALNAAAKRTDLDETLRQRASVLAGELEEMVNDGGRARNTAGLDEVKRRRLSACFHLAGAREPSATDLLRLLRSPDTEIRRTGIYLAGKYRFREMLHEICDFLGSEDLEYDVMGVLESFGEIILPHLKVKLLASSGNNKVSTMTVSLAGKFPGPESDDILLNCLLSYSRPALLPASERLAERRFAPAESERRKILEIASDAASRLKDYHEAAAAIVDTDKEDLKNALGEESDFCRELLGNLSRILSAGEEVSKAFPGLPSRVPSADDPGKHYTGEILGKAETATGFWPVKIRRSKGNQDMTGRFAGLQEVISGIIESDYLLSGIWLKACALRRVDHLFNEDIRLSLAAMLFSPWPVIAEEAALALYRTDVNVFKSVSPRLPASSVTHLETIMDRGPLNDDLVFNRVKAVKDVFPLLPGEVALTAARQCSYEHSRGDEKKNNEGCFTGSLEEKWFHSHAPKGRAGKNISIPYRALEEIMLLYPGCAGYLLRSTNEIEKEHDQRY